METASSSSSFSSSSESSSIAPLPPGFTEPTETPLPPIPEPPPVDNDHVAPGCEQFGPSVFDSLPQYQSHKIVRAAKITEIKQPDGPQGFSLLLLAFVGSGITVTMSPDWMEKHTPEVGGYIVAYPDGYVSYSPASAFESGYMPIIYAQSEELQPLPPGGELAPATPEPQQYAHLELRALIMEELKRLGALLEKQGAITAEELAESAFKHIVARYL